MPSSSSHSADGGGFAQATRGDLQQRFVEAARRAEIVALVNSATSLEEMATAITNEIAESFFAEISFMIAERPGGAPPKVKATVGLSKAQAQGLLHDRLCIEALHGDKGIVESGTDLLRLGIKRVVLAPFVASSGGRAVLGVARTYEDDFDAAEVALLVAITQSAGHALEKFWLAEARDRNAAQQAALARAAKSVNATLERDEILEALCQQIAGALGADLVTVHFGSAKEGLVNVASHGMSDDFVGFRREPGEGLSGQVIVTGRAQVSNAYLQEGHSPDTTAQLSEVKSAVSVPLHRYDKVDGTISAGFRSPRWVDDSDVQLLGAFAELASVACRNADAHEDMRRAAMIDPLTGCLNHGAFQTLLRDEIARAQRTVADSSGSLSPDSLFTLAMLDLDDFKSVNENHGHPAGDALLRRVGDLLRGATRAYDRVARYGGDEFALLFPQTSLEEAQLVVDRAVQGLATATTPDGKPVSATVGIAQWQPGEHPIDLVERADSGMLRDKNVRRGGTSRRRFAPAASAPPIVGASARSQVDGLVRRLAAAGTLGAKIARMLDVEEIAETVATELHTKLSADWCRLARLREDGKVVDVAISGQRKGDFEPGAAHAQDDGIIGRAFRERRAVLKPLGLTPEGTKTGAELAVPVFTDARLWGAIHVLAFGEGALASEETEFVEVVADHLGAALHSAEMYERLDEAYLGTAEALATALEAKDDYTADHARSVAKLALQVGEELGLNDDALRDLHYGAIFHDIGKIAIPDEILQKPEMLDARERDVIQRHPLVGDRILGPVTFLSRVRPIVRHDHERWDGTGYPDGLRGPQIPIGARIVFVVDAYHAMTSDRPYRTKMTDKEARAELLSCSGSQFDPEVVEAFIRVLDRAGAGGVAEPSVLLQG